MMKKILTGSILTVIAMAVQAQDTAQKKTEMADLMRSNGRIYVVIAVMLTILTGLVLYLTRLDRKITKMEKGEHGN
jgi:multisubunit Na+/H+ antiporter MnhB subunit